VDDAVEKPITVANLLHQAGTALLLMRARMGFDAVSSRTNRPCSALAVILLDNQINEVIASLLAYPGVLVCGHRKP
jgi:hypothetical protein